MKPVYADRVYEFLTALAAAAQTNGDLESVRNLEVARKHYLFPLTSEFLGKSMDALREIVARSPIWLSADQKRLATELRDSIKRQWFS
jgi:hypothetical protein